MKEGTSSRTVGLRLDLSALFELLGTPTSRDGQFTLHSEGNCIVASWPTEVYYNASRRTSDATTVGQLVEWAILAPSRLKKVFPNADLDEMLAAANDLVLEKCVIPAYVAQALKVSTTVPQP